MAPSNECVRVVVRCRPLNSTEKRDNRGTIVTMDKKTGSIILAAGIKATNEPPKTFTFDAVFPPDTLQVRVCTRTRARSSLVGLQRASGLTILCWGGQ